jgi:hypothetical protein
MTIKTYGLILGALILAFVAGKYTNKSTDIKTTTTDNKLVDTKTVETEVETKKKDGTIQTVITTDTVQSTKDKSTTDTATTVKSSTTKWSVNAMVAEDLTSILSGPKYGVSVTRQLIGPINVGAFGFTNGLVGVSLGVSF